MCQESCARRECDTTMGTVRLLCHVRWRNLSTGRGRDLGAWAVTTSSRDTCVQRSACKASVLRALLSTGSPAHRSPGSTFRWSVKWEDFCAKTKTPLSSLSPSFRGLQWHLDLWLHNKLIWKQEWESSWQWVSLDCFCLENVRFYLFKIYLLRTNSLTLCLHNFHPSFTP